MRKRIARAWSKIWVPSPNKWMLGLPVGAIVMFFTGIIFWGGFNTALEVTNTEGFCISCHEMGNTVYIEYRDTIHAKNSSGVKASCPDCHVPRPWLYKVIRKIKATNEVYHKLLGTINTPEKFELHRLKMANNVWQDMQETDSRECRNCHTYAAMDLSSQSKSASKKHDIERISKRGETCIDCHKGIAHSLPEITEDNTSE